MREQLPFGQLPNIQAFHRRRTRDLIVRRDDDGHWLLTGDPPEDLSVLAPNGVAA